MQGELADLKTHLDAVRETILARPSSRIAEQGDGTPTSHSILKAAESLHEIAWSLQANPFDPKGCEEIARNAAHLYTMSQEQAVHSERTLVLAEAIAEALRRVDAVLETVEHERMVDAAAITR